MNLPVSLDELDAALAELGCDTETADKAFAMFADIQRDAIVDKVTKDTWIMFLKGIMHDGDVEEASHVAEVKGRNAKIEEKLKAGKKADAMPPSLGGGGSLDEIAERVLPLCHSRKEFRNAGIFVERSDKTVVV